MQAGFVCEVNQGVVNLMFVASKPHKSESKGPFGVSRLTTD